MAVTQINLSDPVSTLVSKTNTISSDLGDKAALTTTDKNNLVAAINEINTQLSKVDSADVINLIQANSMDSSEVLALIRADSGETSIMSNFQKDSANGIGFDSSQGRFFIPVGTINTSMLEPQSVINSRIADTTILNGKIANNQITSSKFNSVVSVAIKDSTGATLATLFSPGS
jgi:hypothetical protein|tara:strand:+ start:27 stop:548 length:522 start_codon:yes stop_codon:yes gene_type:complete